MQLNNPMQLKRCALLLPLLTISLAGCDSGGENEPSERTYEVEYTATATFDECTVTYFNENDGVTQRTIAFAGETWTLSFEEQVMGEFDTALVGFSISCSDFGAEEDKMASGELRIDGETFLEGSETGTSVSIDLDAELTLEGATES